MHKRRSAHPLATAALAWVIPLLISLAACSSGNSVVPDTVSDSTSSRIVNGESSDALPAVGQYGGCTGTVIAPRTVLTAAHCLTGHVASDFLFNIGSDAYSPDEQVSVTAIKQHPAYDGPPNYDNDLGLLTLGEDAPVQPVALINEIDAGWIGRELMFMGYGATDGTTMAGQGFKRSVEIPIAGETTTHIRFGDDGNNICYGDSGGPSIYVDALGVSYVVSVTSYTEITATNSACTGYSDATRVDDYFSFIGVAGTAPTLPSPTPSPGNCDGQTALGQCVGNTLYYCKDGNQVVTVDCTANAATCGFSYTNQFYGCLVTNTNTTPGPTPTMSSGVVTVVTTPTPGPTVVSTPTPTPSVMATPTPSPTFVSPKPTPTQTVVSPTYGLTHAGGSPDRTTAQGCGGETFQGRCADDYAIWCEDGTTLVMDNCGAAGLYCGWSSTNGYYDCLAPAISN